MSGGSTNPGRSWLYNPLVLQNWKLTLMYDGSEFHGWQVQPGLPTVQGTLAAALERVTGTRVLPQGSGRTDAGVHALAQVASCALESPIPPENLVKALNDVLPSSVRVTQAEHASADFHARKSASAKTYRYRILRSPICPPFLARHAYHHPFPLNEGAMTAAAELIVGEHDFTSFAAVDPEDKEEDAVSKVRTVYSSCWHRQGEELVYTVRGSGFLHHMVRNLVGTFLLVGKGTLQPEVISRIIEARDRSANPGATAPASGLYLVEVEYHSSNVY